MARSLSLIALSIGWLLVFAAAGCDSGDNLNRIGLSGSVTLEGAALDAGSLTFFPADGLTAPAANASITQGQYRFTNENGPVSGQYRVEVRRAPGKNIAVTEGEAPQFRWEFEVTVPEQGPATHNFELK